MGEISNKSYILSSLFFYQFHAEIDKQQLIF